MKWTKCVILCFIGLSTLLSSCNKEDKEPSFVSLPIIQTFESNKFEFPFSEIKEYPFINEKVIVVNSLSEIPEEEIFSNEEFINQNIDFSLYSLILSYDLQIGKIKSTQYKWGYDISKDDYQMSVIYQLIKDSVYEDGETEIATYIRNAILVEHISDNEDVQNLISVTWIGN